MYVGTTSKLLQNCTQLETESGEFPDVSEILKHFKDSFDHEKAEKNGQIIPEPGMDDEYDDSLNSIQVIEGRLKKYLSAQKKIFGCEISYFGTDKRRYQLEIPERATSKVTSDYHLEGSKKGAKRYSTPQTKEMLADMIAAEKRRNEALQDSSRRVFEKFSLMYDKWSKICFNLAVLDVIMSLAEYARTSSTEICKPVLFAFGETPFVHFENAYHPCIPNKDTFVPNNVALGQEQPKILLLTGPNMGGKSTLMRQIAVLAVMAQMGSYVPASMFSMSVVDRIFTRLGAHDDILAGDSTFLVELKEAACILEYATADSLVLVDELGRGTSTYDGTAIATAYLRNVINMECRTVFSTHYHYLIEYFKPENRMQLGHMACVVENEGSSDITKENVTFLYKLTNGICPKSYGFNAAKLAGVSHDIIKRAYEISHNIELQTSYRMLLSGKKSSLGVNL